MFLTFVRSPKNFVLSYIDDDDYDTLQDWLIDNIDEDYYLTKSNKVYDIVELANTYDSDKRFFEDDFFDVHLFDEITNFNDIKVEPVGYIKVYTTDNIEINGEVVD